MKSVNFNLLILILILFTAGSNVAQVIVSPTSIKQPVGFAISGPLRNNPVVSFEEFSAQEIPIRREINSNVPPPDFSNMQPDIGKQSQGGSNMHILGITNNYAGQNTNLYPPDANGDVNGNYYFQTVNLTYAIYNKSDGSIAAGPSPLNSIFNPSLPGAGFNNGDPIVLWDENANRWFFAEFSIGTPPYYQENDYILIAVSQTDDPTGSWYSWSFDVSDVPDYPKFGIWQDGYYMATNNPNGNDVYVFDRAAMIEGSSNPTMIGFDNPNRPNTFDGFHCILPLDNDGPWAPSGTPGQFITIVDDEQGNPSDAIWIYELNVDWTTPSNSTFARTQILNVNPFSGNFNNSWNNIPQPGTSQKLDGISTVLMHRAQYRNFNGIQKIVCNHTIAVSENEAAIRWYELDNTGSGWFIAQQGTYNPDNVSRWCASIAMNDIGEIAMGYSVSDGSSTYPGIRFCGQSNSAPPNIMDVAETTIWTGSYSQTEFNRWGDYANISVDPSDGRTFWFTTEYKESPTSTKGTRIASFSISNTAEVLVDQKRESGQLMTGTQVSRWENNNFVDYTVPIPPFSFNTGDTEVLKGLQGLVTAPYEKYNTWVRNNTNNEPDVKNHHQFTIMPNDNSFTSQFKRTYSTVTIQNSLEGTTVIGGKIKFFDPWYIDFQDEAFGNNWRNRGMEEPHQFYKRSVGTSGWQPDFTTVYPESPYPYNGVFLEQPIVSGKPYYSVGAVNGQTISVHNQDRKFYHYKWEGTDVSFHNYNAFQTGVVFHSANAVATDVLKGQLMSDDPNGISSSSQRKMVRTDNGIYHVVYESMGNVWYTYSLTPDFYGEWSEDELEFYNAKNPSIDYEGNTVKFVCEFDNQIWLVTYKPDPNGGYEFYDSEPVTTYPDSYFGKAKPVISYTNDAIFIAYRKDDTGGIMQKTKFNNSGTWNWAAEEVIPGTDQYSKNITVAGENDDIHIAFERLNSIDYIMGYIQGNHWDFYSPKNISSGSGFNTNAYPSISFSNDFQNPYAIISWVGTYTPYLQNLQKSSAKQQSGGISLNRSVAVSRVGLGSYWGGFHNTGSYVNYTNNNSLSNTEGSIITWSEQGGQYSKYVKRNSGGYYEDVQSLSTNGIQPFVSNGSTFQEIKAMVFNNSTGKPYLINRCTNDFSIPVLGKKSNDEIVDISYGRSGVIENQGIEFLFNVGDVLVNGEPVKFVERVDTLPVVSLEDLNSAVKTEPFNLDQQTELIFSNYYYVVHPDWADTLLSDNFSVNFKCELVKASTGEVVGTFEDVTYNKTNVQEYDNPGFLVDCSGIVPGNYYFRLVTTLNGQANLYLTDIQRDDYTLQKDNLIGRTFKGEPIPKVYSLEQNYPNPFNPSTTIRYQLPQDGLVTLKVYDILGREVTTLVNEEKTKGRYEVNFNAENLASGVYLYRIKVNDFVDVKKMLLIK